MYDIATTIASWARRSPRVPIIRGTVWVASQQTWQCRECFRKSHNTRWSYNINITRCQRHANRCSDNSKIFKHCTCWNNDESNTPVTDPDTKIQIGSETCWCEQFARTTANATVSWSNRQYTHWEMAVSRSTWTQSQITRRQTCLDRIWLWFLSHIIRI